MKALLIIDLQNDFLPAGSLAVPDGDQIIPIVNDLQSKFDLVVATQDWHPNNHQSFASQYPGKAPYDMIKLLGQDQVLWPDHCVQNSQGAAISSALDTASIAAIFRKGTNPQIDSYSGFYDNNKLASTGLKGYLLERQVTEVFVCGLAADYCVFFTALDALTAGFKTAIISDATKAINEADFALKSKDFITSGGLVLTSSQV